MLYICALTVELTLSCCLGNLDELALKYLVREPEGTYLCNICYKRLRDKHNAKSHLECKHFPTDGAYSCSRCAKVFNTKNALNCHTKTCFLKANMY